MTEIEIKFNDLTLTPEETEALDRILVRLKAVKASLYWSSEGLMAFVVDAGGGEHLGVKISPPRVTE